nr:uncharacterized protein LOC109154751 [Ipomoea batatas]
MIELSEIEKTEKSMLEMLLNVRVEISGVDLHLMPLLKKKKKGCQMLVERIIAMQFQQQSCSETYQGLVYSVETGATVGADVGCRVILPVSFIGGPRDMRRRLSMSTQEKEDREIAAEYNIQVSEYDLLCVEKLNVAFQTRVEFIS